MLAVSNQRLYLKHAGLNENKGLAPDHRVSRMPSPVACIIS